MEIYIYLDLKSLQKHFFFVKLSTSGINKKMRNKQENDELVKKKTEPTLSVTSIMKNVSGSSISINSESNLKYKVWDDMHVNEI